MRINRNFVLYTIELMKEGRNSINHDAKTETGDLIKYQTEQNGCRKDTNDPVF